MTRAAQLLTGSFMDYAMPRADDLPSFATRDAATRPQSNPLGIKGAGECGTTPATAAIDQRHRRRARHPPPRNAGDARARLARDRVRRQ